MNTVRRFTADMMPQDPFFIGFDRLINRIDSHRPNQTNNYPPYNIVKVDEDHYAVEVAIAGFSEDELTIKVEDGQLYIEGEKAQNDDDKSQPNFIHRGISARSFRRVFTLTDTIVVSGASLDNGILTVDLENIIPDEKKPRFINIGETKSSKTKKPDLLKG
jgi:molecular chaperone IbpA